MSMFKFFSAPLCVFVQLFALNCTLNHDPVSAAPADTALPAISNAPGTINDGQAVQIKGFYFGNKNPTKPIIWADFAIDSNPSSLGQRTTWDDYGKNYLVRTNSLPSGSGELTGVVGTWAAPAWPNYTKHDTVSFSYMTKRSTPWQKIYVYAKRFRDFDNPGNYKHFRIWNQGTTGPNDFMAVYLGGAVAYNECFTTQPNRYQGATYTKNQWDIEEFIWTFSGGTGLNKDGSAGPGNGIWDYTRNGINVQHMENVDNCANTQTELRVLDNFTPNGYYPPNGSRVYMTDIYIDDTYARVIIGDSSTLASSKHREIQIPQTWSDNGNSAQITFVANQGTFPANSIAYLFVVNDKNIANNGKQITWSNSAQPKKKV